MTTNRRDLGARGEKLGRRFLETRGYRIVERNYRSRLGEIDLVCQDGDTIVFVEIKTRTSDLFGRPVEAVNRRKQARLRRLAEEYLINNNLEHRPVRFDVLSIVTGPEEPGIEHLTGAF